MAEAFIQIGVTRLRGYLSTFPVGKLRQRVESLVFQWLLHMSVNDEKGGWWETYHATVSKKTGIPRTTLTRILDNLEAENHIEMVQKADTPSIEKMGSVQMGVQTQPTLKIKFCIYNEICEDDGMSIDVPTYTGSGTPATEEVGTIVVEEGIVVEEEVMSSKINQVFGHFQAKIRKRARATDGSRKKIQTRLEHYTVDQLCEAIDLFAGDPWRMDKNASNPPKWFFGSDDQIEKWLGLNHRPAPEETFTETESKNAHLCGCPNCGTCENARVPSGHMCAGCAEGRCWKPDNEPTRDDGDSGSNAGGSTLSRDEQDDRPTRQPLRPGPEIQR